MTLSLTSAVAAILPREASSIPSVAFNDDGVGVGSFSFSSDILVPRPS